MLPQWARADDDAVDYVQDIKPLLARRCYACHGALKQKNGLRLDTAALARQGGDSGPAIEPGQSGESLLIDAVAGASGVARMPPEGEPLKSEEIDLLRRWIDQGARAPDEKTPEDPARHWSHQPPARPGVPQVHDPAWVRNPIDAFVAAEHERLGLRASAEAPRRLLLRRVYLDLIGLPPTRIEMQAFLADPAPDAYERAVERLLDSPQYGERWGRHWMDVWRYSDWDGFGAEVRESQPHIWRWRDWIVESLNADKPYNRMLLEMLAGDELSPEDPDVLRATGFLVRNWNRFNRNVSLDMTVEHTAKAFLGMTLNCARCHDHMYDPINQEEYYRFRAFIEAHDIRTDFVSGQLDPAKDGLPRAYDAKLDAPTYLFVRGDDKRPEKDRPLTAAVPAVFGAGDLRIEPIALAPTAYYPALRPQVQSELRTQAQGALAAARQSWRDAHGKLVEARRNLSAAVAAREKREKGVAEQQAQGEAPAAGNAAPQSSEAPSEAELVRQVAGMERAVALADKSLAVASANHDWILARLAADNANYATPPAPDAQELSLAAGRFEREHTLRVAEKSLLEAEQKLAVARESPHPEDDKVKKAILNAEALVKNRLKARDDAQAALNEPLSAYTRFGPVGPAASTGRRLALARFLADRRNPRTARVAINHIWLRHMGRALVPTVFDFGLNGRPPSHPALLDWLAVELMEPSIAVGGQGTAPAWGMKHIHRLIVTSSTYRQLSASAGASGEANRAIDPDNVYLWRMNVRRMEAEIVRDSTLRVSGALELTMSGPEVDEKSGMTSPRRSLYFRNSREKKMAFLDLFDRANVNECYRRSDSIVPQQALAMANSPLAIVQSRLLARELSHEFSGDEGAFVAAAFEQVLNRPPTGAEEAECRQFLDDQSRQFADPSSLNHFASGAAAPVPPSADPRQRARENLVHVLLNHNDFLTVR